ncbi:MAG: ribonuclease III [Gammaproteobacteria bacterium]|nr:ribonuclease III [Gammaproteobacteria bacterium]
MLKPETSQLCESMGYHFKDESLLRLALTHRSASASHNERLEFLGDAILGFVVADMLYSRHRQEAEGDLSRLRASLVSKPALALCARRLNLGMHLVLGSGEAKGGGRDRDSILADAVEALIAATYLDGGMQAASEFVHRLIAREASSGNKPSAKKDSKTALQELLQARKASLPEYAIVSIDGAAHEQTFHVECRLPEAGRVFSGIGESKKEAEQAAAEHALNTLGEAF